MKIRGMQNEVYYLDFGTDGFGYRSHKEFYQNVLGFRVEYESLEDKFVFMPREGNHLMFENA